MRVLRVADLPDNRTGGMSRTMYGTGDALAAAGCEVDYLFREHLTVKGPAKLRRFSVPLRLPRLVRRLSRERGGYDVVEIHEPLAAPYCFVRRNLQNNLPPAVLFSYGLEERGLRAELAYRKLKGLPVSIKQRYSPMTVVLQAMYGVRRCSHVICSNGEDVTHLRRAGIPPDRLTQHHSGVDPEFLAAGTDLARFPSTISMRTDQGTGLLFMGSWLVRKGILDVVPAISQVLQKHPSAWFTVAGSGVGADTVLAAFAPELRPRIQVIPQVCGNEALIDLYRRHTILVLPSYFEGQPLVLIEAAALGLAIVTTNVCGMADFIRHEQNGFSVPVGNVDAITRSLEALVRDSALAHRLGEAARRDAQGYTWTSAAEKIVGAYEHSAGDQRGDAPSLLPPRRRSAASERETEQASGWE